MERTYIGIDLDALNFNIDNIKNKIGSTKLLAVIKADAYGHGAVQIARELEPKCDFFGVACIEEAVELLKAGIKTPLLILGYVFEDVYDIVVKNDIRIPIFSYDMAKALSDEAVRQNKTAHFHFVIDTGMSRIGFQCTDESIEECVKICALPNIKAEGIFSHFATADESDLAKTYAQRDKFNAFVQSLSDCGIEIPIKHLNNSAGIMNFDNTFDMVRSGIITYGLYPSSEVDQNLIDIKPVMSWHACISHVKTLEAGREISYGGTYTTKESRRIATVPVGYADGYPRCLSNAGSVLINGKYAPITGRVCMDQFMVDVTDIDGVEVGSEATLIGTNGKNSISVEDIADNAGSFNYEQVCRISRRVTRIYTKNGKEVEKVNYL